MARVDKRPNCKYWYLRYSAGGRQVVESSRSTNKRFAERLLAIRLGEIAEGRHPSMVKSNAPRLKEWAEQFLESVPGQVTRRRYKTSLSSLIPFLGERAKLAEIGSPQIEGYKRYRLKQGVHPATINRDLAVCRRLLKLAARERLIARGALADTAIEALEEKKFRRRPRILTFAEEHKILSNANPLLKTLVVLLIETGLRIGKEGLPLEWKDIDFENDVIHVRRSKTIAGIRQVPMSRVCKAELLNWRDLTGPDFSPHLFPNPSNPRVHLQSVRKPWAATLEKSGLAYFRIYDLRANFASRLSAAGTPDNLLAGCLGHSSTSIVSTYARVTDEYRRGAIRKLEQFRDQHVESQVPQVLPRQ